MGEMIPRGPAVNVWRNSQSTQRPPCIGSDCMMWRWAEPPPLPRKWLCADHTATNEPERPARVPAHWEWQGLLEDGGLPGWSEPQADADARRTGYCGLAGRPEQ